MHEPAGASTQPGNSGSILLVEDDFLIASQMESALAEAGFAIAGTAGSAEEALALAARHRPALIVMDIRLNGNRDGIDVALEVFATYGIRCVFASAHQTAEARMRAQPARPLAWLAKPYSMPSLVEAVRGAFRDLRAADA
ncbi:MAG TPA: response regulator [Xanthobacteraceae bacterium]|nr:response regulator [Xanthobacteraceae bacterium]